LTHTLFGVYLSREMTVELLEENEALYQQAVILVRSMKRPTVVSIQRKFNIGYGRAMNIIDVMIEKGDWPSRRSPK
jgi:DNA segregation ATPase FtsK/SpoIIIE-like protein